MQFIEALRHRAKRLMKQSDTRKMGRASGILNSHGRGDLQTNGFCFKLMAVSIIPARPKLSSSDSISQGINSF